MQSWSGIRSSALALACGVVWLTATGGAQAADSFANGTLTIPTITIGSATYSNLVATIGSVVGGPYGTSAYGTADSYDLNSGELTLQAVTAGGTDYYNVTVTIAKVVSIGGVSGADSFDGGSLRVASATDGVHLFSGATLRVGAIVRIGGGMPTLLQDIYEAATNELTIPAVEFNGKAYTNVVVTVGGVVSAGTVTPAPAPLILQVLPDTLPVGTSSLQLTVIGEGFDSTSTVEWDNSALATTYVSQHQLSAQVPSYLLGGPGSATITVTGSPSVTVTSNSLPVVIEAAPVPVITSVSPSSVSLNAANVVLTLNGANFTPSTAVYWTSTDQEYFPHPETYVQFVSPSQLLVYPQEQVGTPGIGNLYAIDTASGDVPSNPVAVTVTGTYAPVIAQLSPATLPATGPAFALTVQGGSFTPSSVVAWNGSARPTQFSSAYQLTATINASDIATAGNALVTVADPSSGNVPTSPLTFVVAPLVAPTLTRISPAAVVVGGPAFTLTAIGTGFQPGAVVYWNGAPLQTTLQSATALTASVPAAQIAAPGSAQITVANLGSNAPAGRSITIGTASKDAVAYQITPAHTGAINFNSVSFPTSAAWSVNVGGLPSYALIANGLVYLTVQTSGGSQLVALNGATGQTAWGPIALPGPSNAAYEGGRLFVLSNIGFNGGEVQGFDAATGTLIWSTALTSQREFWSPPTAANGLVFAEGDGDNSTLYALDEATGAFAWTLDGAAGGAGTSPAVTVDGVYVGGECNVEDVAPALGIALWSPAPACGGGASATPAVANGVVYAPGSFISSTGLRLAAETGAPLGNFYMNPLPALTATRGYFLIGSALVGVALQNNAIDWKFAGNGYLYTAPIAINQYVIMGAYSGFGTGGGTLYAVDGSTGQQVWTQTLTDTIPQPPTSESYLPYSSLAAGDGLLVVPGATTVTAYVLSSAP